MDIKVQQEASRGSQIEEEQQQPLLENAPETQKPPKKPAQKAIRRTFKGTAHLQNLLPTGSVLTFQIVSPVLTHQGKCLTITDQFVVLGFLVLCALSCFLMCFTDSFRDERGKVRYGVATFRGLRVVDGSATQLPAEEAAKYKIKFIDFLHAIMSVLVFASVSLFDKNVVHCLFPTPSDDAKELLLRIPIVTGVVCSILFLLFPTKRHGVGSPLSKH
ncbi:hypothetical protein Tsubulata_040918 [Turnera subulata]|uniref:DUF679 domain-containing protein n=1 Tax=Turnera subulata TaxID=218843 RepID=A0A9Q0JN81_9ROSI|nr:hypothetical protein Tsubulata_040918 [Turnera subulata]